MPRRPLYHLDRYIEKLLAPWLDQDVPRQREQFQFVAGEWRDQRGNRILRREVGEESAWTETGRRHGGVIKGNIAEKSLDF